MTDIQQLIRAVLARLPFRSTEDTQEFLNTYSLEDNSALITALIIGRDHVNEGRIQADYVPDDLSFDRFLHTGSAGIWLIQPADFAQIIFDTSTSLITYLEAFERCATMSGYDLNEF
ncbi:hypothetical protein [Pantoea cypripedii]|uniref:Uncharacterized protein n=1 Tax=Pantoea cypripedii TaxID=55209 RepID=A0A6B9GHJ4_PANCY|nr:hypothetical protein [Pantoea cypripedii]QGY33175.1 hypothetical protein CUN67_30145 [Pantoea cypripedii]